MDKRARIATKEEVERMVEWGLTVEENVRELVASHEAMREDAERWQKIHRLITNTPDVQASIMAMQDDARPLSPVAFVSGIVLEAVARMAQEILDAEPPDA